MTDLRNALTTLITAYDRWPQGEVIRKAAITEAIAIVRRAVASEEISPAELALREAIHAYIGYADMAQQDPGFQLRAMEWGGRLAAYAESGNVGHLTK